VVQDHEAASESSTHIEANLAADNFRLVDHIEQLAAINTRARQEHLLLTTLSAEAIPRDHPLHEYFVKRYKRFRRGLAALLAQAQETGTLRADFDPDQVAREIIATLDGLHLQWLLDSKEINLKKVLRAYAERVAKDLASVNRTSRA
jgi:hypothetical protein